MIISYCYHSREYTVEIERLKDQLQAARDKDGVYLPNDIYQDLQLNLQKQRDLQTEIQAALAKKEQELSELSVVMSM